MTYKAEAEPGKKINERRMEVDEMRMDVRRDKGGENKQCKDQRKRKRKKKTQEGRLRWYEPGMRSNGESDKKRTLGMEEQGRRRRERTKTQVFVYYGVCVFTCVVCLPVVFVVHG